MGKRGMGIGVFEKVGESIIGDSDDDKIIVLPNRLDYISQPELSVL